jgi:hypothetical protein
MKTLSLLIALAILALSSACLVGCGGPEGGSQQDLVKQGNSNLPPDDGKGPGLVSPVRPDSSKKGKL